MIHLTAGIFGNAEFAKKMGKAATVNDIALYNHGSSEAVFTYACVNSEKVQTLLQVIGMIDVPVIVLSEITPTVGEQLIAISEYGFETGFLMLENVTMEQISPLIKGTCIEKFKVVANEIELTQELKKLNIDRSGETYVPIDNYFNVKSVGTVILGLVKSGKINKYDKIVVQPIDKEVMIKGIQSQDKDFETTDPGMRVGLNLKGIEADELKRGYVIGNAKKSKNITINFSKNKYFRENLKENDQVFVSCDLMVSTAVVKKTQPFTLETESWFVYRPNSKFMIASTKQTLPRIAGSGTLSS